MSLESAPPPANANVRTRPDIFFERTELQRLMRLYGRMVAAGEWRDYAFATSPESCAFWVFRRTAENPLYTIEKRPALARKQGAWAVIGKGGMVLKRGHELEQVLKVFETARFRVVD